MPRVRKGAARHQAKKRIFKAVKGHANAPGRTLRLAKEAAAHIPVKRQDRSTQGRSAT